MLETTKVQSCERNISINKFYKVLFEHTDDDFFFWKSFLVVFNIL